MSRTIAILLDESAVEQTWHLYRISHLARIWESNGLNVVVQRPGDRPVDADLYFPHVDLSVVPARMRQRLKGRAPVVNHRITDIRRTSFSENLLEAGDSWDGPVVVKTNANYGGIPEMRSDLGLTAMPGMLCRIRLAFRALKRIAAARSFNRLAWTEYLFPADYRVYRKLAEVPRGAFRNTHLVVEKFLPEREGEHYCLRSYSFFGSEGFATRTRGTSPIIKGASGSAPEFVEPHEDIVAARFELGFDYGKFDYTIHDGQAVLLDVNTTPTFGPVYAGELSKVMASRLAGGIRQWVTEF